MLFHSMEHSTRGSDPAVQPPYRVYGLGSHLPDAVGCHVEDCHFLFYSKHKMPRFRKVYCNTSHRTRGTPSNCSIEFNQDVDCTGPGKVSMAVTSVSLPNVFFGISAGVNDKLYIYQQHSTTESLSVNTILTLPAGNYTASTLSSSLLSALQAAALSGASFSVSYSAVTQRMTITSAGLGGFVVYDDYTLKNLGRRNPLQGGASGNMPKITNPQSLQQILNIPPAPATPSPSFQSGIITLARVTEVFLRSPNLTNMSTLDANGRQDVLKRILLDRPFGDIVTSDSNIESSDLMDVSGKTLRAVDFQLTDSHGNVLDLHSMDYSFCLNFVFGDLE